VVLGEAELSQRDEVFMGRMAGIAGEAVAGGAPGGGMCLVPDGGNTRSDSGGRCGLADPRLDAALQAQDATMLQHLVADSRAQVGGFESGG
jgi:hypothetical protein